MTHHRTPPSPSGRPPRMSRSSSACQHALRRSGQSVTNSWKNAPVVHQRQAGDCAQSLGQIVGLGMALARPPARMPVRPHGGQIDRRGQGAQRLVGADVGAGLLPADVLLPGLQGQHKGAAVPDRRWSRPRCGRAACASAWPCAAIKPRYGPPKARGMPRGWPSPTAMSAPHSPGVFSSAQRDGVARP